MQTTTTKILALGAAAALGLAACVGGEDEGTVAVSGEPRPVQQEAAAPAEEAPAEATQVVATVDDPASTLRADLTWLLQEHVHLTGFAVGAVVRSGPDDPATQAAVQAIDENAVALGDVVSAVPSVGDPTAFVETWREHVAAYVDYTVARVDEDDDGAEDAFAELEDLLQPMADFFEETTEEELSADELYGELETHVTMVTEAIDAMVAEDAEAPGLLDEAAGHMDVVAAELATGIVAAFPEDLTGDPLSVPAETRAAVTSGLVQHTHLTLLAAQAVVDADGAADDPAAQAASTTLDDSAESLANGVSGAAGNDGREAFLDLWRPFLTATTDYAAAAAGGDTAAADAARTTMVEAPSALVEVFGQATAGNAPADVAALLDTHVQNLLATIDAMVAGDPTAYTQARAAAQHARTIADGLAAGLVAANPAEDTIGSGAADADTLGADPDTAAPDQSGDGTSDAGTVGTSDEGTGSGDTGPAAAGDG